MILNKTESILEISGVFLHYDTVSMLLHKNLPGFWWIFEELKEELMGDWILSIVVDFKQNQLIWKSVVIAFYFNNIDMMRLCKLSTMRRHTFNPIEKNPKVWNHITMTSYLNFARYFRLYAPNKSRSVQYVFAFKAHFHNKSEWNLRVRKFTFLWLWAQVYAFLWSYFQLHYQLVLLLYNTRKLIA